MKGDNIGTKKGRKKVLTLEEAKALLKELVPIKHLKSVFQLDQKSQRKI